MNAELVFQRFQLLPEDLQIKAANYIDRLVKQYSKLTIKPETVENEEISPEIKALLDERIANHKKNPHHIKTWEEVEERLLKKYNYAV